MLNEKMIEKMTSKGFNRWQKGDMDRLYINAKSIGLDCTYYNSGNVKGANFKGEHISNSQATKMLGAKTYVDVKTGAVVSGHIWLEEAVEELIAEIEAEIEAEEQKTEESKTTNFVVWFHDRETGATSAIDNIVAAEGYTAEDYIKYCEANADEGWCEMLKGGTVTLEETE